MENNYLEKNEQNEQEVTATQNLAESAGVLSDSDAAENTVPLKKKKSGVNQIAYSKAEERINIISHLCGAVLALVAAILMIIKVSFNAAAGSYNHPALTIVAVALYSFALIELYTMSTLYHFQPYGKTRRAVFRRFDHCSVAFLIAGTYAPYMLVGLANSSRSNLIWGIVIASVVLGFAVLVIVFNAINVHKFRIFCMIAYVLMGWSCLIVLPQLINSVTKPAFWCLIAGGFAYTLGIVFYRIKKIKFNHAIWHFFVLGGSALHFVSIYFHIL